MKLDIQLFADAEVSIKFDNKITNEKKLERYAETLSKINAIAGGINSGVIKQIEASSTGMDSISKSASDTSEKISTAFNVLSISKFAGAIKKLGASFTSLAKQSFDFLENFNLFQVAFNGNYNSAERFVNKMAEMYGLDESWLTQTIGKFKQLTNAMNLTAETGEKVSKLLTQMSLDISSLYNVDIDRAAQTLSSAMAGQTKPIRGVTGGDITQATLQNTLDNLGIDAAVSQLSFAEKRLLIIISLTKQLNASIGDMGRTIESPSNQLRIMNEQWERLTRAVGNVFLPILSKVLPYLNAILMVLTEIIRVIATLFGYKQDDFDYFSETAGDAWDLDNALSSAGTSAKKLKQGLRGFDKLNVITTPSAGGAGGGAGAGGINPAIMKAFNSAFDEYQNKLKNVKMRATEIRDAIMEWLGFTKHINEETDEVYFTLDKGFAKIKLIAGVLAFIAGLKLVKGLAGLITGTSKLGKLLGTGGLYTTIKNIVKAVSVLGAKDGLLYVFYDSKLGKGVTTLTSGFTKLAGALGLSSGALLGIIAAVLALAAAFVYAYKTNDEFREKVDKLVTTIKETLMPIFKMIGDTLKTLWEQVLQPILEDVLKPLASLLIDILTPVFETIIDRLQFLFDNIIKPLMPVLQMLYEKRLKFIIDSLDKVLTVVKAIISVLRWVWDNIIQPVSEFVINFLKDLWQNWLEPIYTFLKLYILIVIYEIKQAFDKLKETWEKIKTKFKEVWEEYIQPKIDKIKEGIDKLKEAWEKLKEKWHLPDLKMPKLPRIKLTVTYSTNVGKAKKAIYEALGLDGWPKLGFESYAKGGLPPVGQLFIANEKGPEMVGQIGGQSFVANQNQMMDLLDKKIGNAQNSKTPQVINIYLDEYHKLGSYTLDQLQGMARTNGSSITIGA